MLQFLLDSQLKFQKKMGFNFEKMTVKEKTDYIKEHTLWLTDEAHEMLRELPFVKSWSKKYESWSELTIEEQLNLAREEYIDMIHFVINIGLALGLDQEEIIRLYSEKHKINYQRQESGY